MNLISSALEPYDKLVKTYLESKFGKGSTDDPQSEAFMRYSFFTAPLCDYMQPGFDTLELMEYEMMVERMVKESTDELTDD
jgi:hypothetical protein